MQTPEDIIKFVGELIKNPDCKNQSEVYDAVSAAAYAYENYEHSRFSLPELRSVYLLSRRAAETHNSYFMLKSMHEEIIKEG